MHSDVDKSNRPTTAREIARSLGVSQPTVSRVLNGTPGHRYSAETRRRIFEEAERMGYRPHAVARSLRERRTRVVGFYSGHSNLDARNAFLAEIIGALQHACGESGQFLLLQNLTPGTPVGEMFGELLSGRIDGLVLHTRPGDPLVPRLAAARLPVAAIADRVPALPSVVCDDADGIRQVIAHLAGRGHQRIAFLHPTELLASVEVRFDAYLKAMAERGWEPLPISVNFEEAEPALDSLLARPQPPTAVCCWNDMTALHLLHGCRRRGLHVPDDLAVTGFDGMLDPRIMAQALTTVTAFWPDVTLQALEILQQQMCGEKAADVTMLPVVLREGETT